jgi:hypothetical protein
VYLVLRCLAVLFLFAGIVFVLKSIARLRHLLFGTMRDVRTLRQIVVPDATSNGPQMVRCLTCGAFVSASEAITLRSGKTAQPFCSHDCLQRHVRD